jgi:hypothetical protein
MIPFYSMQIYLFFFEKSIYIFSNNNKKGKYF